MWKKGIREWTRGKEFRTGCSEVPEEDRHTALVKRQSSFVLHQLSEHIDCSLVLALRGCNGQWSAVSSQQSAVSCGLTSLQPALHHVHGDGHQPVEDAGHPAGEQGGADAELGPGDRLG